MADAELQQNKQRMTAILAAIEGAKVIFPDSVIAEIVDFSPTATETDDVPTWYLGLLKWRSIDIPLISLEALNHDSFFGSENKSLKIIVMHGVSQREKMPYWGFVALETPRMVHIDPSSLVKDSASELQQVEAMRADFGDDNVIIPDIPAIEKSIVELL